MARQLRIEFENALYHVTSRGNEQRDIFRSDVDRRTFLEFLGLAARRFNWSVTAWVLMSNHFHLVIQTREPNLSRGMQWLNGKYVGWFNRRHTRSGHLFQGRFKAFLIDKDSYFAEVLRYVVLNPVRAGMVECPEDYRWSSYRATAGLEQAPSWHDRESLYCLFSDDVAVARATYRDFIDARVSSPERLWDKVINGMYLGSDRWACEMRSLVESRIRSTDHPLTQRAIGRPTAQTVIAAVAGAAGVALDVIRERTEHSLRSLVAWIAWHEGLVTLRSIAASLRLRSEGYVSALIRRCERDLTTDRIALDRFDRAMAILRAG